jgi:hypothetical protein
MFVGLLQEERSRKRGEGLVPDQMDFEAFWIPSDLMNEDALAIGERWLRESTYPGQRVIALHAVKMTRNDPTLELMSKRYPVVSPQARGSFQRGGNAVLAVWASEEALQLAEELGSPGGGVCVIEGRLNELSTWSHRTRAVNLADPDAGPAEGLSLDQAATRVLDSILAFDGHNRFYGAGGKEHAVRGLRDIAASDRRPKPEELEAYAIQSGETDHEGASHLRELYEGVLAGKGFRDYRRRPI